MRITLWKTDNPTYGELHPGDIVIHDNDLWLMVNRTDDGRKMCRQVGRLHQKQLHFEPGDKSITRLSSPRQVDPTPLAAFLAFLAAFCVLAFF